MASRSYIVPSRVGKTPTSKQAKSIVETGPSSEFMAAQLGIKRVKSATPSNSQPAKKRKVVSMTQNVDEDDEWATAQAQAALAGVGETKAKRGRKAKGEEPEERRLRRFRNKPPTSYLERLDRVRTQRMFLIARNRTTSADGTHEEEVFDIAGSTGNIYQVTINKNPDCTCPDASKGNQCKHIIYVSNHCSLSSNCLLTERRSLSMCLKLVPIWLTSSLFSLPS